MTPAPFLELRHLTKRFGGHAAVRDLSLDLPRGRVLALLGPSGSGKTTTLRLLGGFDAPDHGAVIVDGEDVTRQPARLRRFGMVFQHYALFPHLDVSQNITFGLRDVPDAGARVREVLALVDLPGFEDRRVDQLSGGQQQRVALARALAPEPRLLLLDEPLSNLDPALRDRTRRELKSALTAVGITTVLVTHDQEEAFAVGDLVAVLRDGMLQQIGSPPDLYERPATHFVATFVGKGGVLAGEMVDGTSARVGPAIVAVETREPLDAGRAVSIVVRPEHARLDAAGGVPGTVIDRTYMGGRALFRVETAVGALEVEAPVRAADPGKAVHVTPVRAIAFPAEEAK